MPTSPGDDMWLVIHVPKAAGTSLRWALKKRFGKSRIAMDYGPHSKVTSDVVRKHLYADPENANRGAVIEDITAGSERLLIGHFPLRRYGEYFEAAKILTMVREPLTRCCSEYLHRTKNGTFKGSLAEFFEQPCYQNLQSRILKGVADESFVGLAEYYAESIKRINSATRWGLSTNRKNVGRRGGGKRHAENLSGHELGLFKKANKRDLDLYQKIKARFLANAAFASK